VPVQPNVPNAKTASQSLPHPANSWSFSLDSDRALAHKNANTTKARF
jgi:hypothetical protein